LTSLGRKRLAVLLRSDEIAGTVEPASMSCGSYAWGGILTESATVTL
jgi:hypothetical protein